MGFRYRKSIKVMPGVKLNLSKSGISTTVGKRGASVNVGHGRVRSNVGIPGSGLSYSTSTSTRSRNNAALRQQTSRAAQPRIPKQDTEVLNHLSNQDLVQLDRIARDPKHEHALPAAMLAAFLALEHNPAWSRQMLEWVWSQGHDPAQYRLITTYLPITRLPVQITPEIEIDEALGRNLIGLTLAEWRQADGDITGAIDIVEQLEPTAAAALSLAELYHSVGRYDDVVDLTNGLTNTDDVTALLIVYRGTALRELGHHEAARLAFKEALRFRSRPQEIRFRALVERALTYHAEGKLGMARKDLDRIRAEDSSYPGLNEALTALGLDTVAPVETSDTEADVSAPTGTSSLAPPAPPPPNWYPDPTARHEHRYWDGTGWTPHVSTNGTQSVDPIGPAT